MNGVWATRMKILGLLACSTGVLLIRDTRLSVLVAVGIAVISILSSERATMKERMMPILTVCLFIMLFQLVFNTTVVLHQRILLGVASAARILGLSLLVFIFTQTTSISRIVGALSFLPASMRLMITISFALIPAIMQETKAIGIAQQARGFRSGGLHIFGSLLPLLIPLLNRTLARAEHIGIVMQTRGYEAQEI